MNAISPIRSTGWLTENLLCAAATALVFGQLLALGATTPLLSSLAALLQLSLALVVVLVSMRAVTGGYWVRLYPVLFLLLAAIAWAAWPDWQDLIPAIKSLPAWRAPLEPDAGSLEILKLAGAAACALAAAVLSRTRGRALVLTNWLVVGGSAYVIFSLWLWRWDPNYVWGVAKGEHTWSFTGSLLNGNAAGCAFGMISILALGLTQSMSHSLDLHEPKMRDLLQFGAGGFGVIVALAATALTGSRTSLILTAALTAALAMADLARIRSEARLPRLIGTAALGVILLAVAVGVGFAPIAAKTRIGDEFGPRLAAYADYWKAAQAAPLSGYGLGSFATVNAVTLPSAVMDDRWNYAAAHCAPLQAALEGGMPFLLLLAAALVLALAQIIRAWFARRAASAVSLAALAAALLALGSSLVDVALNVPAVAAFAAIALGLAWGSSAGLDLPPRIRPAGGWAKRAKAAEG